MNAPQPATLLTVQATPEELPYLDRVVCAYVDLLETRLPQGEEGHSRTLADLRSFQARYLPLLETLQREETSKSRKQRMLSWQVPLVELFTFTHASLSYLRLLAARQVPAQERFRASRHLHAFRRRFIQALPPPKTLD